MALVPGTEITLGPGDWRDETYRLVTDRSVSGTVISAEAGDWPRVRIEDTQTARARWIHVRRAALAAATAQGDDPCD